VLNKRTVLKDNPSKIHYFIWR